MKCIICEGLVVSTTMHDQSFNRIEASKCMMCGNYTYPNFIPLPVISDNIKGGRKGKPTMFIHKKGVTSGK